MYEVGLGVGFCGWLYKLGILCWCPYMGDPSMLGPYWGPLIPGNSRMVHDTVAILGTQDPTLVIICHNPNRGPLAWALTLGSL